jgi:hypothetical protein
MLRSLDSAPRRARRTSCDLQTLEYVGRRTVASYDVLHQQPLRNLVIPAALLLGGCVAVFIRISLLGGYLWRLDAIETWKWTGFMLAWNVGALVATAWMLAKTCALSFGPLSTATLKLAAIATSPYAIALLIERALGGGAGGFLLGIGATLPFAWWLFMCLFEFDPQESLICVCLALAMRWLSYLLYWMVL